MVDPDAVSEFDHRRVLATGHLRHDQEMLVGPRMREGQDGYVVVTPLERDGGQSTLLVNRGWISKRLADKKDRVLGLPQGVVTIEGLLREPWKKNMFTPDNKPEEGRFYFPDIEQMAELTGSQPVWIEETMSKLFWQSLWSYIYIDLALTIISHKVPDMIEAYDRESKGIPIGRAPAVNLRNNHGQYIMTW